MRFLFGLSLIAASALVTRGSEQVLLVVNGDSWASTYLANEYAALRGIPAGNIVRLKDVPSFERMGVGDFRERILRPALKAAEERGLGPQLDYLVYSADFPTAIDVSEDMAGKKFPDIISQPASISSLTFFYQLTLGKNTAYLGLNSNFYFRGRAQVATEAAWPEAEQRRYAGVLAAMQKVSAERQKNASAPVDTTALRQASDALTELKAAHPKHTELLYNLACVRALLGEAEGAVAALRDAVEQGWWDLRHAEADPDLASIRGRPDFQALRALAKGVKFEQSPASGFRGAVAWQPGGRMALPDRGVRYLLSTMLAYTSGRGNSVAEALAALQRSVAADGARPAGTIYYLENSDIRSTTREWGFGPVVEKLGELGVAAKVESGVLPVGKKDVAGLMTGVDTFDWAKSGSSILPGAICEHLTSFGGMLTERDTQTPLTDFIRAGAAGASGTVGEPFAVQPKFPTPFLHWFYAQGCTLAESFYQSVAGPYQLLIVGDPLCAPWRKRMAVKVEGLTPGLALKGTLMLRPTLSSPDGLTAGSFELLVDGRRVAAGKPGDLLGMDTTKLADGVHTLSVVASASDTIASRARLTVPVVVHNRAGTIKAEAPEGAWVWDRPVEVRVSSPGAQTILLRQGADEVGRLAGGEGVIKLDARRLGQGRVQLQPVALDAEGKERWGTPVSGNVVPPVPLAARDPRGVLEKGFLVTPRGGKSTVVHKADGNWLAEAGVAPDGEFVIEGWFNVPETDVYQFQWRDVADLRVIIDGLPQEWPRGKEWSFLPISLGAGTHQVRLEGKAIGAPKMELRFGGAGAQRWDGSRFQHRK